MEAMVQSTTCCIHASVAGNAGQPRLQPIDRSVAFARCQLEDYVADELDNASAANETILHMDETEHNLITRGPIRSKEVAMTTPVRAVASDWLRRAVYMIDLEEDDMYRAEMLLEICYARRGRDILYKLPSVCMAIVRVLRKASSSNVLYLDNFDFNTYAEEMTEALTRIGLEGVDGNCEMMEAIEAELLLELDWEINVPTIWTWLRTYSARFTVLTRNIFSTQMVWVWQMGLGLAETLMLSNQFPAYISIKELIGGVLCLMWVHTGLLPLSEFRPQGWTPDKWDTLYLQAKLEATIPVCSIPCAKDAMLEIVQMATGTCIGALQQQMEVVLMMMRETQLCRPFNLQEGEEAVATPPPSPVMLPNCVAQENPQGAPAAAPHPNIFII